MFSLEDDRLEGSAPHTREIDGRRGPRVDETDEGIAIGRSPTSTSMVRAAPATTLIDAEEDEPTGVSGTLRQMPVTEIVQMLQQGGKTALVEVRVRGGPSGAFAVEKGRVVFAEAGGRRGEPAFLDLVLAARGVFRIRYGRVAAQVNIEQDTTFLLLEGMRLHDEAMAAEAPRRDVVPRPPVDPHDPFASVPSAEAEDVSEVVSLDGARAVVEAPPLGQVDVEGAARAAERQREGSGLFSRFFDEAGVPSPSPPVADPSLDGIDTEVLVLTRPSDSSEITTNERPKVAAPPSM